MSDIIQILTGFFPLVSLMEKDHINVKMSIEKIFIIPFFSGEKILQQIRKPRYCQRRNLV